MKQWSVVAQLKTYCRCSKILSLQQSCKRASLHAPPTWLATWYSATFSQPPSRIHPPYFDGELIADLSFWPCFIVKAMWRPRWVRKETYICRCRWYDDRQPTSQIDFHCESKWSHASCHHRTVGRARWSNESRPCCSTQTLVAPSIDCQKAHKSD